MHVARWQQLFLRLTSRVVLGVLIAVPTVVIAEPPAVVLQIPLAQDDGLVAPHRVTFPTIDLADRLEEPGVFDRALDWAGLGIQAQLKADNTLLPIEAEPGLQFSLDPDHREVVVGWRFQF